jgi:hypothetical protein
VPFWGHISENTATIITQLTDVNGSKPPKSEENGYETRGIGYCLLYMGIKVYRGCIRAMAGEP